jgi:hypothetical protein
VIGGSGFSRGSGLMVLPNAHRCFAGVELIRRRRIKKYFAAVRDFFSFVLRHGLSWPAPNSQSCRAARKNRGAHICRILKGFSVFSLIKK